MAAAIMIQDGAVFDFLKSLTDPEVEIIPLPRAPLPNAMLFFSIS